MSWTKVCICFVLFCRFLTMEMGIQIYGKLPGKGSTLSSLISKMNYFLKVIINNYYSVLLFCY